MHIDTFRIDRFGALTNLQVASLTDGLNVLVGPEGSGKSTLVQFAKAMLFGFSADLRQRYLPSESRGFGGALTLSSAGGQQTISRYDDGSLEGRLTVQHADGRLIGRRDLHGLLSDITATLYDCVLAVDYRKRPELDDLLQQAAACGFRCETNGDTRTQEHWYALLRRHRDELQSMPHLARSVDFLRQRRDSLAAEIDLLVKRATAKQADHNSRLAELGRQITDVERQLQEWYSELQSLTAAINDLEEKKRLGRLETKDDTQPIEDDELLRGRLRDIVQQSERWRNVLREIAQRRASLQENRTEHGVGRGEFERRLADPRRHLRSLERAIRRLRKTFKPRKPQTHDSSCECRRLQNLCRAKLHTMQGEVYRLCAALSSWQSSVQQRDSDGELAQLARCEAELRQAIQHLDTQRQAILTSVSHRAGDDRVLQPWQEPLCGCVAHPRPTVTTTRVPPQTPSAAEEEELERQLASHFQRRSELRTAVGDAERKRAQWNEERRRLSSLVDCTDEALLAEKHAELRNAEHDLATAVRRQSLEQTVTTLETEIQSADRCPPEPDLIQGAAAHLRRLSAGTIRELHVDGRRVWVIDEQGVRREYQELASGLRDLVYLSACLSLVAALRRRGKSLPLVVHEVFANLDSRFVAAVAEVLRDFAVDGQQVLILTRYEHVASVFRLLNAPVRGMDSCRVQVELPEIGTTKPPRSFDMTARPVSPSPRVARDRTWDAEEFPGELVDRVFRAGNIAGERGPEVSDARPTTVTVAVEGPPATAPAVPAPVGSSASIAEYFLTESDPIDKAPSMDLANAERMRKVGILRIGDLLRALPTDIAIELRCAGITSEMIASWQAQARLVCRVPRLRAYDARILVACGITTPEQLAQISPQALRSIVREFVSGSSGQAVLSSGTEDEMSRVTEWINPSQQEAVAKQRTRRSRPSGKQSAPATPVVKMSARTGWRYYLNRTNPVADAPSIGPRTAERLGRAGIRTVADLLSADAASVAAALEDRRVTAETIRQWQQQTALACRIPQLRGHDAQILVAVGVTDPEPLARTDAAELWRKVSSFVGTKAGKRLIRNGQEPSLDEIHEWIRWAAAARQLNAA